MSEMSQTAANLAPIANYKPTLDALYEIQTQHPPIVSYLPHANKIYDIDLNTRTIHSPEFLSIQRDHKSEVIYFRVNRYFDHMDLSTTPCVIQYLIPGDTSGVPYLYIVPFFDVASEMNLNKLNYTAYDENTLISKESPTMIFPWCLGGAATATSGKIKYAIRFYKMDDQKNIIYNLNTSPAESEIRYGLEVNDEAMKIEYDTPIASQYDDLIAQFQAAKTNWTVVI